MPLASASLLVVNGYYGLIGATNGVVVNTTGNVTLIGTYTGGNSVFGGVGLAGTLKNSGGVLTIVGNAANSSGRVGFEAGVTGVYAGGLIIAGNVVINATKGSTGGSEASLSGVSGAGNFTLNEFTTRSAIGRGFSGTGAALNVSINDFSTAARTTLTAPVALNGVNFYINEAGIVNISGAISGAGNVTTAGSGTTILAANNTYAGTTTISGGTLQVGAGGTSGSLGSGAVTDNANLTYNLSGNTTVANVISGTGNLTQAGSGTTILTANNTYAGTTTISGGTLQVGVGGTSGSLGSGAVTDNANLTFNVSGTNTVAGVISGTGKLTQAGSGTTILTGNNTYAGPTMISGGTLQVGSGGIGGSLGVGAVTDNANLVFNFSNAQCLSALAVGGITGSGNLTSLIGGSFTVDRAITLNGTTSNILLEAGRGGRLVRQRGAMSFSIRW
ncbi:autotransporter-associated beta strand repeat-containing protein [Pseudomonas sp. NPDC087346]|uniref:beta strand repeat-containing protein n=1 Tax=Pseudomonas sp. NPDC087346 TaxID=3364438 RepID=UPI00382F9C5E